MAPRASDHQQMPHSRPTTFGLVFLGVAAVALVALMSSLLPAAVDWSTAFRPAALELIAGRSPYNIEGYFNAPWALLPLIPLALLPESIGRGVLALLTLAVYAYITRRLGAKPLATAVVLLSPPVLHGLLNGSIDWIAAFGLILPPQIGLLFVAVKPQIGVAVMIYWLAEAWREGWKKVIRTFWPITVLFLLSLALFGPWPIRAMKEINLWWNASLWPASIPVGLGLLAAAMRTRKMGYAMAASPCLSPYVLFHSWIGALLAIVPHLPETIAATVGLWLLVGIQALR